MSRHIGFCLVLAITLINLDVVLAAPQTTIARNLPHFLKKCNKNDPNLDNCLREAIELLRSNKEKNLTNGIPELLIPPCEPLSIPEIRIKQHAGAIRMECIYSDVVISGLSNFTIRKVHMDKLSGSFRIDFWFPILKMSSKYLINGKVLLMPLHGHGNSSANFTDVDASVAIKHTKSKIKNQPMEKWAVGDVNVEFNIGSASIKLDNLFNGDLELGAMMNKFLNENWREITAEIRPAIQNSIGQIIFAIASGLHEMYSLDEFIAD